MGVRVGRGVVRRGNGREGWACGRADSGRRCDGREGIFVFCVSACVCLRAFE